VESKTSLAARVRVRALGVCGFLPWLWALKKGSEKTARSEVVAVEMAVEDGVAGEHV
jgi:hypothetical protein